MGWQKPLACLNVVVLRLLVDNVLRSEAPDNTSYRLCGFPKKRIVVRRVKKLNRFLNNSQGRDSIINLFKAVQSFVNNSLTSCYTNYIKKIPSFNLISFFRYCFVTFICHRIPIWNRTWLLLEKEKNVNSLESNLDKQFIFKVY